MFDYVRCVRKFPDGFVAPDTWKREELFQTKDLSYNASGRKGRGPDYSLYEITAEGRLALVQKNWDGTPQAGTERSFLNHSGKIKLMYAPALSQHYHYYELTFVRGELRGIQTAELKYTPDELL